MKKSMTGSDGSCRMLGGRLVDVGRDDPELDLGLDFLAQGEPDRVQAQLLERALDLDVVGVDREVVGLEGVGDLSALTEP